MARLLFLFLCLTTPALGDPRTDAHGDPLPDGALVRFGTIRDRIGSTRVVRSHALSPDGKYLAAETREGITLWDVDTGCVARRLPWRTWQGDSPRFGLCFSPDGKFLIRMAGRVVARWDLTTGEEVFDIDYKEQDKLRAIAYVPGADQLIVTSERLPRAWILDAKNGRVLRTISCECDGRFPDLFPAGKFLVGRLGGVWILFDAETGLRRSRLPSPIDANEVIAIAPDGKRAWIATDAGELRSVDTGTGITMEKHKPSLDWTDGRPELAISRDGATVYMAQGRRAVHRWDVNAGKWLPPIEGVPRGKLIPHPDGKRLLVLGNDGVLRRYDLTTLKQLPGTEGFEFNLRACASPDGQRIAIASSTSIRPTAEGRLDLFDNTGKALYTVRPGDHWTMGGWSTDGRWLTLIGHDQITLVDTATGRPGQVLQFAEKGHHFQTEAYIATDGNKLIAPLNYGERLVVFDLKTGMQAITSRTAVGTTDLSPDGRTLVHFAEEGGLRLFDVASSRFTGRWSGPPARGRQSVDPAPRFSPDGSYLLTWELEEGRPPTFASRTIAVLRDPATLAVKREFEAEEAIALAFSPDGQWLALGRGHGAWSLWDVPTGERLGVWEGHRDRITSIGFAGPGRVLTGSDDLTALLWDLRAKEQPKKPVWEVLSGDDARDVYRAIWALAADPKAIELLRAKVPVQSLPAAEKLKQWIADLAADRFAVREGATKELQNLGRLAEPDLRAARDKAAAEEVRARLDSVLAKLPRERVGIEIVHARAVLAMELAGIPEAKKLLAEWAAGAPGARLTIDAKAALARLAATR